MATCPTNASNGSNYCLSVLCPLGPNVRQHLILSLRPVVELIVHMGYTFGYRYYRPKYTIG